MYERKDCITFFIDGIRNKKLPNQKYVFCFDPDDDRSTKWIIKNLEMLAEKSELRKDTKSDINIIPVTRDHLFKNSLYSQFNFNNFINGKHSDIAYKAAKFICNNINEGYYNPLMIIGDVGLGKTHLLHAIGNNACLLNRKIKIHYTSAKGFIDKVINGIRYGNICEIKSNCRDIDLLLINNIQFLENKESAQEEFFHILYNMIFNKKQIVITADRYPREMINLEARLVNRFISGLTVRIGRPDFETRMSIIKYWTEQNNFSLRDEVVELISRRVKTNVNDVIGVLINIKAQQDLIGKPVSIELTKNVLKEILDIRCNKLGGKELIKSIIKRVHMEIPKIILEFGDLTLSQTDQIAMYVFREITGLSFPVIGHFFNRADYTVVLHALKNTAEWMSQNSETKQKIEDIIHELSSLYQ